MDIGFYIAELLRNQDEVSLPGLGTFSKSRVSGTYDAQSNSFTPPSFQVVFSEKTSDVLLLQEYISSKKNLSASSAEYFIKKFASSIAELLETSGSADLNPLGVIRQKNDDLVFEPSEKLEFTGKFYGLKPVADLWKETIPKEQEFTSPPAPVKEASIEDFINSNSEDLIEEQEEIVEEPRRSRLLLIILGAVLLAIVAGAMLYLINPRMQNYIDRILARSSVSIPENIDSVKFARPAPLILSDSTKTETSVIAPESVKTDSVGGITPEKRPITPPVEAPVNVTTTTIEIIGAAFGKKAEADRYVEVMKKKGLDARILDNMPGPLFKVSLASFPDLPSAQTELSRIKKEVEKDAWPTPYKSKKTQ